MEGYDAFKTQGVNGDMKRNAERERGRERERGSKSEREREREREKEGGEVTTTHMELNKKGRDLIHTAQHTHTTKRSRALIIKESGFLLNLCLPLTECQASSPQQTAVHAA